MLYDVHKVVIRGGEVTVFRETSILPDPTNYYDGYFVDPVLVPELTIQVVAIILSVGKRG